MLIEMVKDARSYADAMARIDDLMELNDGDGPFEGAPEFDELQIRAALAEKYEEEHFSIEDIAIESAKSLKELTPADVIKVYMAWNDYNQSDLSQLLGSRSRASEVLNERVKGLSRPMIQALNKYWRIPAEFLIGDIR